MSISDFKYAINKGLSRPNRYKVEVYYSRNTGFNRNKLHMTCDSVTLGGRQIVTKEEVLFGQVLKVPYQSLYGPLEMTFITLSDAYERVYWERWQNHFIVAEGGYLLNFYDDYVGTVIVTTLDEMNRPVYKLTYHEAYPIALNDVVLRADETDTWLSTSVTLTYAYSVGNPISY